MLALKLSNYLQFIFNYKFQNKVRHSYFTVKNVDNAVKLSTETINWYRILSKDYDKIKIDFRSLLLKSCKLL